MTEALRKTEEYISRVGIDRLLSDASRVIVAFSGGADSAFLLCLLHEKLKKTGVVLEAAHLNHMIRGAEADRDEMFCRRRAEELGIKLHVKRVDIPTLSREKGLSTESAARQARYAFFDELSENDCEKTLIATAHNADDNLETVLFNMLRGSAARGMCGIPPVRDGKYIRPILPFTGSEIRSVCQKLGIEYVLDSTNSETEYTRNRIRHNIVPELEKIAASPQASVLRMTESLRQDADHLDLEAENFPVKDGKASAPELSALPDPILSRVILRMYKCVTSPKTDGEHIHLEQVHIRDIVTLLKGESRSYTLHVPGGTEFYRSDEVCGFRPRDSHVTVSDIDRSETELTLDGEPLVKNGYEIYFLSEKGLTLAKYLTESANIYNLSIHKRFRFDKIYGKLIVRCRREGDTYRYGGMTRRVKKIMSEKHMPVLERDTVPVICDDEGILWIPGFPEREGSVGEGGEQAYIFVVNKNDAETKNDK